ncbi:hypothetical protein [Acinetobacter venetianus]|uniref:hypothetical protein n=1 Tax=Acinetobacter venetianus TaxID=52133 RepID=UPI0010234D6B|nr:hypothetical protein [Acinetobacter venetianus]RZG79637.1 hypothetical protein EXE23_13330 [Acinetobacter venetianus]
MDGLSAVIGAFISGLALLPLLTYLSHTLVQKMIKKDELVLQKNLNLELEKNKTELQVQFSKEIEALKTQHTKEVELLKSQLTLQNAKLQIAYSGVFSEHVDVLKKLFNLTIEFDKALGERRSESPKTIDVQIKPLKLLKEFNDTYSEKGIFIPSSLDEQVKKLLGSFFQNHFMNNQDLVDQAIKNNDLNKANELSEKMIEHDSKLRELRDSFRNEIRSLIGVD